MKANDNELYKVAQQFAKDFPKDSPEAVIFGYAKLLLMNENQVRTILPDECMDDLEAAHKWFEENKLDLDLIRSGLLLLVACVPAEERKKNLESFLKYVQKDGKAQNSEEILKKALECAFIPIKKYFTNGKDLKDIFVYQSDLQDMFKQKGSKGKNEQKEEKEEKQEKLDGKQSEETNWEDAENTPFDEVKDEKPDEKEENGAEDGKLEEPVELMSLPCKYKELCAGLMDVVKGQDAAIIKFVKGYNQTELLSGVEKKDRPGAVFFFFGPPGVGKTLTADTAAKILGLPCEKFDMSQVVSAMEMVDIMGMKGECEGRLFKFVRKHPKCVIIFDEIEKAPEKMLQRFLQLLGSGEAYNAYHDVNTSFKDAIIIFTSNVGSELYRDRGVNLTTLPEKVIVSAIENEESKYHPGSALSPELCSRLSSGNLIMFNHIPVKMLAEMTRSAFDNVAEGMREKFGVNLTYAKELPLLFLYFRGGEIDARVAAAQSERFLKDEIYELICQAETDPQKNKVRSINIDIDWKDTPAALKKWFKNPGKADVLVVSQDNDFVSSIENKRCSIHRASTVEEAKEIMKLDLAAIYIDPYFGADETDGSVMSISDYNTVGIRFFHDITEKGIKIPVYMMELDRPFSEIDRTTLINEGATGTVKVDTTHPESFRRMLAQTMEELYLEKESLDFTRRSYVLDYYTKQELTDKDGEINIRFYGLRKKTAIDAKDKGVLLSDAERPKTRFKDVVGAKDAVEKLQYYADYLRDPKKFVMSEDKIPKGALLFGPPGTGKTLLARAMAGECDVSFFQTTASAFKNKWAGDSEKNIRNLFAKARKHAPSIIFIDEIDAIGRPRSGSEDSELIDSMLETLFTEMDGFTVADINKPVFVLAATNFGARTSKKSVPGLDEGLIRRFDDLIYVDLPTKDERCELIRRMLNKKKITTVSKDAIDNLAERTTGSSPAIIENIFELAVRKARSAKREMTDADLLNAIEEYFYGEIKEHSPEYYHEVAIHETGHAYVSYLGGIKPAYITIESRGDFGGYMKPESQEDVPNYTREQMLGMIRTSLAGRAAEMVFFEKEKSVNTGASSDLEHATDCAWALLCRYGMDDDQLIVLRRQDILASSLAPEYVAKVNEILKTEMKNTIDIIQKGKSKIEEIAAVLEKENRLTGAKFEKLMKKRCRKN